MLKKSANQKKIFLIYTLLFIVTSLLVFSWVIICHKTLIFIFDGKNQHFRALIFYSKYLRGIISDLIHTHRLIVPQYSFYLGQGGDILQVLSYYCIGDPFTFLSVLVPENYMWIYYDATIILRLYVAGIAFILLCFEFGLDSLSGITTGALSYVFSFWGIAFAGIHPFFLTPLVFLPFLIIGVERIRKGQSLSTMILSVFFASISNFYFFYMLVIMTVIYVIVRFFFVYSKTPRDGFIWVLKTAGASILGLLMSSVIIIPTIYATLSDVRHSVKHARHLFYPIKHYLGLIGAFSNGFETYELRLAQCVPALFAVILLFILKKKSPMLKTLVIINILFLIFPIIGQMFNGFSYISNRWTFSISLVFSFALVCLWDEIAVLEKRNVFRLGLVWGVYCLLNLLIPYSRRIDSLASLFIGIIMLFVLFIDISPEKKGRCIVVLTMLCAFSLGLTRYSALCDGFDETNLLSKEDAKSITDNETTIIPKTDGFFRYSGNNLTINAGLSSEISSTQYYWSLTNPYEATLRSQTSQREIIPHQYEGYDGRTILNTISGVKYFLTNTLFRHPVPYGYEIEDQYYRTPSDHFVMLKNDNPLPLGFLYENTISYDAWKKLKSTDKEEIMLEAAVVDEKNDLNLMDPSFDGYDLPFTIEYDRDGLYIDENQMVVTDKDAHAYLKLNCRPDCELYFVIEGLQYEGIANEPNIYLDSSSGVYTKLTYETDEHSCYNDRHDFCINLGHSDIPIRYIMISNDNAGVFTYDRMYVRCLPMDTYKSRVLKLASHPMTDISVSTDMVEGNVTAEKESLLFLSIPYSEGWELFIDGQKADLLHANVAYMGAFISPGDHHIKLLYHTPFKRIGEIISILAAAVFLLYVIFDKKRGRKDGKQC